MILNEVENQRLDIIPVDFFLLRNGNIVLAVEDMSDSLYFEESAGQW